MLIDVPSGITKLQIRFDTPARFSTQSIVIGSVAEDELVENAVINAGDIALRCHIGFTRPIHFNKIGKPINIKVARPKSTVRVNSATEPREDSPVVIKTFAIKQKTP